MKKAKNRPPGLGGFTVGYKVNYIENNRKL